MAKLRFGNLNAEVEGDVKEIASLLRELNVFNQSPQTPITSRVEAIRPVSNAVKTVSDDELFQKLPDKEGITRMIENLGKPFSFTLVEQQKKIFGRIINSRENRPPYSKFYDLHKYARNAIKEKYGGDWNATNEVLEGHQTTRYTWIAGEKIILESPDRSKNTIIGAI